MLIIFLLLQVATAFLLKTYTFVCTLNQVLVTGSLHLVGDVLRLIKT
jgi:folylpolyglutamate synthase/dihydropteroate synthase